MIRFCSKEDISKKEYGAALERKPLLLCENVWKNGREYFKNISGNGDRLVCIPVVDEVGELLCFAYQDTEADRELRFLEEIQETYGALQFSDMFPDKTTVTVLGCNELSYDFARYLVNNGVDVYVVGKYWEYLGYRQNCEKIDTADFIIYGEGTNQGHQGEYSVQKILCSVSGEFECIDRIYEENYRWGIIKDADCSFEELTGYLQSKEELILIGTGEKAQDTYDLLLSKGIDIYGFMESASGGRKTLLGKPVLCREDVAANLNAPVLIQCTDRNSALGTEEVDNYSYYGCKRNQSFYFINDYTHVPESKLVHALNGKKVVFAGDKLLCKILQIFYKDRLGNRITSRYSDDIMVETIRDEIVVSAFFRPYGEEETNRRFTDKLNKIKKFINEKTLDYTEYFESICHFTGMMPEEEKYRLPGIRPRGIVLGKIPAASGNIFFRDILDGHIQILKMDYTVLNHNLLAYCIRLSGEKAECIQELFWQIYYAEANPKYFQRDFPNKEKFDKKMSSLLTMADRFTSQELFMILTLAYEAMFDNRGTEDLSDKVIYWEPHSQTRAVFDYYARWLEDAKITGTTVCTVRNRSVLSGSRMCFYLKNRNRFWTCVENESTHPGYESPCWQELTVRFEDLKLAPAKTIGYLCEKIGIQWSGTLLQTTRRGRANVYYSTTGFDVRPVYDSYEEFLSTFDRFRVAVVNGYEQKKYGYPYLETTEFSRKELQAMYLKEFRFEAQAVFRDEEEKFQYKRRFYRRLSALLWENRKQFLLDRIRGTEADCSYEDISRVHRFWTPERERALEEIKQFISECAQIIFYGTGVDAEQIFGCLSRDEKEKLLFCDKRATKNEYEFQGLPVISPKRMIQEYGTAGIVITSSLYGEEIESELKGMGIAPERMYRNRVGQDMRKY